MRETVAIADWVTALKAAAEPTRMRLLMLLAHNELSVKDLTLILGQSQPRLSRHLKLLNEAGLVERYREGSWAYFHLTDRTPLQRHALGLLASIAHDDPIVERDRVRAAALKAEREAAAQAYFRSHAADWDRIRALHVAEADVEAAMREALGEGPFAVFVDLGTGTGRMLELFQDRFERGLGIDANQAMLGHARSRLSTGVPGRVQVRHGDIYNLGLPDGSASVVCMHQVLHYLADPRRAIMEAARVLAPGGELLIADFAPHELEFLREKEAHERLGFSTELIVQWMRDCGLEPRLTRALEPQGDRGDGKLTVCIWLARRPKLAGASMPVAPQEIRTQIREAS